LMASLFVKAASPTNLISNPFLIRMSFDIGIFC
jgi:hypothetical protein